MALAGFSIARKSDIPYCVKADFAIGGDHIGDHFAETFADGVGVLIAHQTEADFRMGLGGQHGLETRAGIAAPHAVDLAGGARPDHLDRHAVLFAGGL